jgi:putative selenate reductase
MTYEMETMRADLALLEVSGDAVVATGTESFLVGQELQIAVLSDFCNECGNCVTVCPTSGKPYVDKPRFYLNRGEFEAENDNAFMLFSDSSIESRIRGETHRLVVNGALEYTSPAFRATLHKDTFELIEASLLRDGDHDGLSLTPAVVMYTIMKGLHGSMPHLPVMSADGVVGTLVTHPGYEE